MMFISIYTFPSLEGVHHCNIKKCTLATKLVILVKREMIQGEKMMLNVMVLNNRKEFRIFS